MTDFFEQVKALSPELSPRQVSDILNEVEVAYFAAFPDELHLPEEEQNEKIIESYKQHIANKERVRA